MILREQTYEQCGYYTEDLRPGSEKKIIVQCDYCDTIFIIGNRSRIRATQKLNKDACKNCKYKKRADTNLAKYGAENVSQVKKFQDKRLKTLEQTGYFDEFDGKRHADRIRQGVRDKYGVDNVFQLDEVKEKAKNTTIEKYGVEHHLQNKKILGKQKKTNLDKYGCENVFQNDGIKSKAKTTNLEKYGVEYPTQSLEVKAKIKDTLVKSGHMVLVEDKTRKELAEELGKPYSTLTYQINKYGLDQALSIDPHENSLEVIVASELDKVNIIYSTHKTVAKRKTDFILPDYNIVIECDGLYWHSDLVIDDNNYHVTKLHTYEQNGYRGLFFRQDEINYKLPIVMSIIQNACRMSSRIFARKCKIVEMNTEEKKEFFNSNHLMGVGRGKAFGLKYNGELVTGLQVVSKDNKMEISRFCHTLNTTVVGGFSRLLTHTIRKLSPSLVFTFIDRRYGSGEYLSRLGFKFVRCSPSFRWVSQGQTYHRMKFPGNDGYKKGLTKIWDCGQARWEKCI